MLPVTGRGGWEFSDSGDCMSRYTRLGPTPFVAVTNFVTGRSLGGSLETFRGGRAGFKMVDEKPTVSGTVKKKKSRTEIES